MSNNHSEDNPAVDDGQKSKKKELAPDTYEKFAKETYSQVYEDIKAAASLDSDLPILIVSAEMHKETDHNKYRYERMSDEKENPILAAAYTHISAIQASAEILGKDSVVVSFELDQETLDSLIEFANDEELLLEEKPHLYHDRRPMFETLKFCVENGYEVVASDPLRPEDTSNDRQINNPERFEAEIDAIGRHALRTDNPPKAVIHIGGVQHIGILQGLTIDQLDPKANLSGFVMNAALSDDDIESPFEGIFSQQIFYNSVQDNPEVKMWKEMSYPMNPDNAIQIDPPGRMRSSDIKNIAKQVIAASEEYKELAEQQSQDNQNKPTEVVPDTPEVVQKKW